MKQQNHCYVLTGGPGAGKTTVLKKLQQAGFIVMPEAGRAVIRQQMMVGGHALPWKNPLAFAEAMFQLDMRHYEKAEIQQYPVFFDRGLPDLIGYLQLSGKDIPQHIEDAARTHRYNTTVFLAPFWPEIYITDDERHQSAHEAEKTAAIMEKTYRALGYTIEFLPELPVKERVSFIKNVLMRLAL